MTTWPKLSTALLAAIHVTLVLTLLAMALPQLRKIPAQVDSGYIPPDYAIVVGLWTIPIALSVAIVVGLVAWSRGRRRWLVLADAATLTASWSVLVIFVFANDVPLVLMCLSPLALLFTVVVAHR